MQRFKGKILSVSDLSKTAKEIKVSLSEPIDFLPGSFMNVFFDINGEKIRRAYSISSSSKEYNTVTFSIRLSPGGAITPLFWSQDMVGQSLDLMGPLGLNTVDKMAHSKVYLFAFGVGAGVIKSIADYFTNIKVSQSLTIYTGSRTEDEILYENYFNDLAQNKNIHVKHVVSSPAAGSKYDKGYIQDFIDNLDFNESDVYVCGQEKACASLCEKIKGLNPTDCNFYIEAFH